MAKNLLFPIDDEDLLISVYQKQGRTLDDLPYTEQFKALYEAMYGDDTDASESDAFRPTWQQVFHRLHNLRKAGKLPRLGRAVGERPRITADEEALLVRLVADEIGEISKRDTLPYTAAFEEIATRFNAAVTLDLDHHAIWRLIAKLAK